MVCAAPVCDGHWCSSSAFPASDIRPGPAAEKAAAEKAAAEKAAAEAAMAAVAQTAAAEKTAAEKAAAETATQSLLDRIERLERGLNAALFRIGVVERTLEP